MADIFNPDLVGAFSAGANIALQRRAMNLREAAQEDETARLMRLDAEHSFYAGRQDARAAQQAAALAQQVAAEGQYKAALEQARARRMSTLANARPEDMQAAEMAAFQETMHLIPTAGGIANAYGSMMSQNAAQKRVEESANARVKEAELRAESAVKAAEEVSRRAAEQNASRERIAADKLASDELRSTLRAMTSKAGGKAPISKMDFISRNLRSMTSRGMSAGQASAELGGIYDEESAAPSESSPPAAASKYDEAEKLLRELEASGETDFNVFIDPRSKEIIVRPDKMGPGWFGDDTAGIGGAAAREKINRIRKAGGDSGSAPSKSGGAIRLKASEIR